MEQEKEKEERRNPRNMKFEYVLPSSWWRETLDSHCLLIDVPGFKKEEVRIRTHNLDHLIVSGERQADDNKLLHFEQSYKVPEGCNVQETSAILEDETYYVIIPKKLNSVKDNTISTSVQGGDQVQDSVSDGVVDNSNTNQIPSNYNEVPGNESSDSSFLDKLSKKLKKTRCLVLTAFLAFTLGVLVSHRYQSTTQLSKINLISYQKGTKKRAAGEHRKRENLEDICFSWGNE